MEKFAQANPSAVYSIDNRYELFFNAKCNLDNLKESSSLQSTSLLFIDFFFIYYMIFCSAKFAEQLLRNAKDQNLACTVSVYGCEISEKWESSA